MDAVLAFLNNPLVLAGLGLIIKFVPGVRSVIANKLIPILLSVVAYISQLVAPQAAHAAGGPLAIPVIAMGFLGLGGVFASLGTAVWQAAQAWAFNEMFLRHSLPPKPKDSK